MSNSINCNIVNLNDSNQQYNGKLTIIIHKLKDFNTKASNSLILFKLNPNIIISFNRIRYTSEIGIKGINNEVAIDDNNNNNSSIYNFNDETFSYTLSSNPPDSKLQFELIDSAYNCYRSPTSLGLWMISMEDINTIELGSKIWIQLLNLQSLKSVGKLQITIEWDGKIKNNSNNDSANLNGLETNQIIAEESSGWLNSCLRCCCRPGRTHGLWPC